jgi:ribosomal protein S18
MKMNQAKQVVKKTKYIQQEYNELNKLNWKICNDLKQFLSEHERMI